MDLNRVKEILSSNQEFFIDYNGMSVWINSVDPTSSMAVVSEREFQGEKQLVSLDSLEETGQFFNYN